MKSKINLLGVYTIPESSEVHLIELEVLSNSTEIDLGKSPKYKMGLIG